MSGRVEGALSIAVTHELEAEDALLAALRDADVEPLTWSSVETVPGDVEALRDTLSAGGLDWLVLTSRRAVVAVSSVLDELPDALSVATVGRHTAEAAREAGWPVRMTASGPGAEALVDELAPRLAAGVRILFAASDLASDTLEDRLAAAGASVRRVTAYRTRARPVDPALFAGPLRDGSVAAVTYLSPSAARSLCASVDAEELGEALRSVRAVAIGPTTAEALDDLGFRDVLVSPKTSKRWVALRALEALGMPTASRT